MVENHHLTTTGPDYETPDKEKRNETATIAVYEEDQDPAESECQISLGSQGNPEILE